MFGGYLDVAAYDQLQNADYSKGDFISPEETIVPSDLEFLTQPIPHWSNTSSTIPEDFILISEFSEIEGPQPVCKLPLDVVTSIDLNTFAVKILSVDYQGFCSEPFSQTEDTQVLMVDVLADVHCFVHYFTLYDVCARGFVRPMCIAYLTSDKEKLHKYFLTLRKHFLQVSRFLKYGNRKQFHMEIKKHAQELQTARDEYTRRYNDDNNISEISLQLSMDSLSCNISEVFRILNSEKVLLNDNVAEKSLLLVEDILSKGLPKNMSDQMNTALNFKGLMLPKLFYVGVQKKFEKQLRNLFQLCELGTLVGMALLVKIQKNFRRDYMTVTMEEEEKLFAGAADMVVTIGGFPVVNLSPIRPDTHPERSEHDQVFQAVREELLSPEVQNFLVSSVEQGLDILLSPATITVAEVHQVDESVHTNKTKLLPPSSLTDKLQSELFKVSSGDQCSVRSLANHLDNLTLDKPGHGILKMARIYASFVHMMFTLLIGRPLVILSSPANEESVRCLVQALHVMLPDRTSSSPVSPVVPWRKSSCTVTDLLHTRLHGICVYDKNNPTIPPSVRQYLTIVNLNNHTYIGPTYAGGVLSIIDQVSSSYKDDPAFIAFIHSLLVGLSSKVTLYCHHYLQLYQRNSARKDVSSLAKKAEDYLISQGLTNSDCSIVQYLGDILLEKQIQQGSAPVSGYIPQGSLRSFNGKTRTIPV